VIVRLSLDMKPWIDSLNKNCSRARVGSAWLAALAVLPAGALPPVAGPEVLLDPVVVTAAGYEQRALQAPASISVILQEDLQERRVSSLAEALTEVEGVDVGASAGKTGGLNISLRGMPSDYTLILVDGRRQNVAGNVTPNGFGETSTSFLPPPAAIERIEVIRGPMSTLYGSDAMGGVVNIITRKVGYRWGGSLSAAGTLQEDRDFGDSASGQFYISGPLVAERVGLTLRGGRFKRSASDLQFVNAQGQPIEVSKRGPSPVAAELDSLGARVALTPHRDVDLWVDFDWGWQTYDNRQGQLGTLGVQGYAEELKFNRAQATLAGEWRVGTGIWESSLIRNTTETLGRIIPNGTPGQTPGSPRELSNENLVFDSKLVQRLGNHTVSVGGQYWEAEMVDGVAPTPYTHTQWAVFAEDEWKLLPDLRLTVGMRRDDHSSFGSHLNPRAYLVWNLTDNWVVKGGVSRGFKAPRLDQTADGITGFTGQGTHPTIGTPGLRPENSLTTELTIAAHLLKSLSVSATIFHNQFDDKIASGPGIPNATFALSPNRPGSVNYGYWPDVDLFSQLVNVDEAVTRGVELSGYWRPAKRWHLSGNYTYTESEQKSGAGMGQPLSNTPKHMVNGQVRWRATRRASLWLRGEYRSERYRGADSATSTARATHGDYRPYGLLHLGGGLRVSKHLQLNATINNLLDRDFVDYRPYVSNTNTGAISYTSVYSNLIEPRRLWLSATLTF